MFFKCKNSWLYPHLSILYFQHNSLTIYISYVHSLIFGVILGSTLLRDVHIGIPSSGGKWSLWPLLILNVILSFLIWKSHGLCSYWGNSFPCSRFLWIPSLSSGWFQWFGNCDSHVSLWSLHVLETTFFFLVLETSCLLFCLYLSCQIHSAILKKMLYPGYCCTDEIFNKINFLIIFLY